MVFEAPQVLERVKKIGDPSSRLANETEASRFEKHGGRGSRA